MKKTTKNILAILLILFLIGFVLTFIGCQDKTSGTGNAEQASVSDTSSVVDSNNANAGNQSTNTGFQLNADGLNLEGTDGINFMPNSVEPTDYSADLKENLSKTAQYLKDNPNKQLAVTGHYQPNEKNESTVANLGLARAEKVKAQLVSLGANDKQIITDAKSDAKVTANEQGQYANMIDFAIKQSGDVATSDTATNNTEKANMEMTVTDLNAKPLTLYFKSGAAKIELSAQQKDHLVKIMSYLKSNPSTKAVVTGHTDSSGTREQNITVGKKRAKAAADYLVKQGLNADRLVVDSKGPDQPIADNATAEGRTKNRRVTITIAK
ncbi:MAG: OmpA family protein [Pasteurella sp.]|nr:OmpA family protein [Pasteurella sp.]